MTTNEQIIYMLSVTDKLHTILSLCIEDGKKANTIQEAKSAAYRAEARLNKLSREVDIECRT